jgi:predicted nuclease with TOPRIM domain
MADGATDLVVENEALRAENATLRAELDSAQAQLESLRGDNESLLDRVARLEGELARNSEDSSKAPSH